ncbi:unnamed protein product, partial [Tilletia laevis]
SQPAPAASAALTVERAYHGHLAPGALGASERLGSTSRMSTSW